MAISPERLSALFRRYYAGIATPAETEELMDLVRSSQHDDELAHALRHAWEHTDADEKHFGEQESQQMLNAILTDNTLAQPAEEPFRIRWVRYAAAAVIVIAATFAFYRFKQQPTVTQRPVATNQVLTDIPPGGNRAFLVLADGAGIHLDSAKNGLLARTGDAEITKTDEGKIAISTGNQPGNNLLQRNLLTTPKGGQYQLTLSDGSKVWLNASSSVRFPAAFAANERRVEITGEVYFEVTKDKKRPFRVKFGDSEVEVLGTSFNIMAYPDEKASKTTLLEGSVRLSHTGQSRMLVPGQQGAIQSDGAIVTATVDTERETAWKQGLFYFRDSGIREIMRDASRWYDIEVEYRGKIPKRQFTGKVSRHVNISELLNMLRYAGVNSTIENRKVVISM
ncbi:MAG: FecR domain-containing protein [Dyadobacter sp.]|uniref:FecR family protein n=1 Tax=Dyadobacter sp. TaxID=1914288 RepID=UPI001B27FAE0|nr:FecR family protein [Dyadobacter sp.]MBO9611264.1 FecR domain-containing protein [Dyadobacter sp.]